MQLVGQRIPLSMRGFESVAAGYCRIDRSEFQFKLFSIDYCRSVSMNELTQVVFSWFILILGLSYLLQTENWIRLAGALEDTTFRFYPLSLLILLAGLVIVHTHNVWVWQWPVAVTVLGWLLVIKNTFYLLCTSWIDQWVLSTRNLRLWLRITGTILSVIGTVLIFRSISAQ
jgi:hypothetical protein